MKHKIKYIIFFILIFIILFSINKALFNSKKENTNLNKLIFNIYSETNINLENSYYIKGKSENYKNILDKKIIGVGFLINSYGNFLTAKHLFYNKSSTFYIKINNKKYKLKIIKKYKNKDLVLGKIIDFKNKYFIDIKNYNKNDYLIYKGQEIFIIKNNKKITGKITGTNQEIKELNLKNLIKTNIQLFPGDSGTPVFNKQGKVIGIFTAIKKGEKISFFESLLNIK